MYKTKVLSKKLIQLSLLLLSFSLPTFSQSTSKGSQQVTITIDASNYKPKKILVVFEKSNDYIRKEITLISGKGEVTCFIDSPTKVVLVNLDPSHNIKMQNGYIPITPSDCFIEPGETIHLTFDNAKWPEMRVDGGKINEAFNSTREQLATSKYNKWQLLKKFYSDGSLSEESKKEMNASMSKEENFQSNLTRSFIESHPRNYASLYFLNRNRNSYPLTDLEVLYNKLKPYWENDLADVKEKIKSSKAIKVGAQAPDFVKKDKDGKEVRLSQFRGKYVIIDFWGTWCGPCRSSHPHLVSLYQKYHSKGVEFINIASEGRADEATINRWKSAIEADGLTWTQILNDMDKSPDLVKLFNISGFPTKMLIDKEGKILVIQVGTGEDIHSIDDKLKELFD